jgi:hypothetical protein
VIANGPPMQNPLSDADVNAILGVLAITEECLTDH